MLCYPQNHTSLSSTINMAFQHDSFQDFPSNDQDQQLYQSTSIPIPDPLDNFDVYDAHVWNHDDTTTDQQPTSHLQQQSQKLTQQVQTPLTLPEQEQALWDALASTSIPPILQDSSPSFIQLPNTLQQSINQVPISFSQVTSSEDTNPPPMKRRRNDYHIPVTSTGHESFSTLPITTCIPPGMTTSFGSAVDTTLSIPTCSPLSIPSIDPIEIPLSNLPITSTPINQDISFDTNHEKHTSSFNLPLTKTTTTTATTTMNLNNNESNGNDDNDTIERLFQNGNYRSTVAKQRPKQWKRPTPSKFCHVCGRKSHTVQVVVCSRIEDGMCRKVVCKYCMEKYEWDVEVLSNEIKRKSWICPHCTNGCVAKAQCNTYGKTNYKRHLKLRKRRVDKALANATALKVEASSYNIRKFQGNGSNC